MRRALGVLLLLLCAGLLPAGPALAHGPDQPYVSSVVTGWETKAVSVDPSQRGLVPDAEAKRLAARVTGHKPTIRIAIVPAAALNEVEGASRDAKARAFIDAAVDIRQQDGIYLVVFGGAVAWASAVGTGEPVGDILTEELTRHSRSEPVALLDGVLTELGVPGAPSRGFPWPWIIGIAALLVIGVGAVLFARRRSRRHEGPALYRPSYDVLPDEADTLDERRKLAREDVTRFGEELDAADVSVQRTEIAADVQAAMDAYADAGRVVDGEPDDKTLREVRATVEYGRWRLASAQAQLAGTPAPPRRAACFFDPAHGTSVTDWMYTPPGGRDREIPVCAACRDRISIRGVSR